MKTLSYISGKSEEIKIGQKYYFGQLWDGQDGDAEELLESGAVSLYNENMIDFEIVKKADNPMETVVKIIDLY